MTSSRKAPAFGWALLKSFGPGILLILATSSILLWSDPRRSRQQRQDDAPRKVALFNYISVPVLEDGESGMIAGLAEGGFADGKNIELKRFNAEGDRSTAILIAKELVGADFDAILTLSTPVLQAVANANVDTQRTHVFTLTTDPWGAGIGISREDPSQHPPYMTGQGTLQPVAELFDLAREANPDLNRVGVAWNPAEANSEASTIMAREACKTLGIDLVEATVDSSSAVLDAVKSLLNRDVQAIWAGGDSTVAAALESMIATAREGGVPVFTNMPSDVKQGALFSLGADYYEVGRASGRLAAKVLKGKKPADIPVENFVPRQLAINQVAQKQFSREWEFGPDWAERAAVVVDDSGVHEAERTTSPSSAAIPSDRVFRVSIVYFAPSDATDAAVSGIRTRMTELGYVEGRNVKYEITHAQGDIALIPAIMQSLDQSETDLVVSLTTPCLTSAASIIKTKPVVFTEVYDPIAAGAGQSATDHISNVTGVGSFPPLAEMIDAMEDIVPDLKTIGVVYNNAEANSQKAVEVARQLVRERGLKLEEVTVNNTSEVFQAATALALKNVDVLWEIGDNTVNQGLEALIKAGNDSRIPVVNSDADAASRGATVGAGISFYDSGYAAGDLAAEVLRGTSPAEIPFKEVTVLRLAANLKAARQVGITFSDAFLGKCSVFHGLHSKFGRRAKLAFVELSDGPALDEAERGFLEGLAAAGLSKNDIDVHHFNAQGEISQLPQIFAAIETSSVDLILTSTTPAMIAAAQATQSIPIVFTVASEPSAVGVVPEGRRQANLVGVYDDPPISELLTLAVSLEDSMDTVGTIWDPAEPNSEISVKRLREACEKRGLQLIERHAASTNDLREATATICQAGIDILVISADNVTSSGFPAIYSVTSQQQLPVYCTEPDLVKKGATAAIGIDYYDWGRQSARLAAQVLAGRDPASIPNEKVASIKTVIAKPQ